MNLLAVFTTVGSRDEARKIAAALVERRLAACAQISEIESFYRWQGAVQHEPEFRLVVKTTAVQYPAVEAAIRDLHSYELPAVHAVAVENAYAAYAAWVEEGSAGMPPDLGSERRPHPSDLVHAPPALRAFWDEFAAHLGHDPSHRFYEAFHFDDNAPSADELAALVLAGRKRATAGLVRAFEAAGKALPKPGDLSVVTLFSGDPVCVIETRSVRIVPFSEVSAEFAATEGEGDGSLAYWRRAHTAFFGRECLRLGREFSPDLPVVCEEFEVVFRGGSAAGSRRP